MRSDVVALYVDPRGPYPKLVADWYDEKRDARTYAGPLPVVAHPPCGPWSCLAHLCKSPNDKELGFTAFEQVRRFGGVLEQPKGSRLFTAHGQHPQRPPECWSSWDGIGFSLEVEQVAWGHVARKRTWLYIVGVAKDAVAAGIRSGGTPTHWISGFRSSTHRPPGTYKKNGCAVPPGIKVCSAQQRRRTPLAFAEWLLDIAAQARRP